MATPLILFTLAWLIGLWLASRIALPAIALGIMVGAAAVGTLLTWRMRKLRWLFVLALAAMLGALRFNLAQPHFDQTSLATYNDQPKSVIVEGVVAAEPDVRDAYTNAALTAEWPDRARDPTVSRWAQLIAEHGASRIAPQAGQRFVIEPGVEMTLLHPDADAAALLKGNDASLVTRLTFGSVSFLFTADVEVAGEAALIRSGRLQSSTVLKAAHHGSKTSTSPEFLALADPLLVVISVGAGNPLGLPGQLYSAVGLSL